MMAGIGVRELQMICFGGGKPDNEPKPGDLIEIFRGVYEHWAVYVGDGYVVHLVAPGKGISGSLFLLSGPSNWGRVLKEELRCVVSKDYWKVNDLRDHKWKPKSPQEIVEEALSWVDKDVDYNLFAHNCEHFATSCRYGKEDSRQVQDTVKDAPLVPVKLVVKPALAGLLRILNR